MSFKETNIAGVIVVEPKVFSDNRGYFFESYNKKLYAQNGIDCDFVQDNQSFSSYGTVRGLHCQLGEFAQAKLVSVVEGAVLDVAVDFRKSSPTYGKHFAIELSAENKKQLFLPRGCLHGFAVLSETAKFSYKCDNFYNKESEFSVIFNDKDLNIDWKIDINKLSISDKDKTAGSFKDAFDYSF